MKIKVVDNPPVDPREFDLPEGFNESHIEDVVVREGFERKQIGGKLVESLLEIAKNRGCYKTILDCKDDVKEFYEKIGFKHESNCMRFDH